MSERPRILIVGTLSAHKAAMLELLARDHEVTRMTVDEFNALGPSGHEPQTIYLDELTKELMPKPPRLEPYLPRERTHPTSPKGTRRARRGR